MDAAWPLRLELRDGAVWLFFCSVLCSSRWAHTPRRLDPLCIAHALANVDAARYGGYTRVGVSCFALGQRSLRFPSYIQMLPSVAQNAVG